MTMRLHPKSIPLTILLGATLALSACGDIETRSEPLPFVLKVNPVQFVGISEGPEDSIAPDWARGDELALTERVARSLRDAGLFTRVVIADDAPADLELSLKIDGDSFGPGSPLWGGATFSTLVWLVVGPMAWIIEDREYSQSNISMTTEIRTPSRGENPGQSVFNDRVVLKGLRLSMIERANTGNWLLNIFVPPFLGDGDPTNAGRALSERAIERFIEEERDRIRWRLPAGHQDNLRTFLVYFPNEEEAVIVARNQVRKISIACDGGTRREISGRQVEELMAGGDTVVEIGARASQKAQGIGTRPEEEIFYQIPLARYLTERDKGLVRIHAFLDRGTSQWTIDRRERLSKHDALPVFTARTDEIAAAP